MAQKARIRSVETDFLPDDMYLNDLDRDALELCRKPTKNVRLYKGSPFLVGDQRLSLFEHVTGLERFFLALPPVKTILQDKGHTSPGQYSFVKNTLPKFVRHDMDEIIAEPQTFLQKSDPYLKAWKPNLEFYKFDIVQLQYDMAQRFSASGQEHSFLKIVKDLQDGMKDFDAIASSLHGIEYRNYVEKSFTHTLKLFKQKCARQHFMLSSDTLELIAANNDKHKRHYCETEMADIRRASPEGLMTKLVDKNHDQYNNCGRKKLKNPNAPGLMLDREGSHLFIRTVDRAEEYLEPFFDACDNDPERHAELGVFKTAAYAMVYDHLCDYALLAAPVIQFDTDGQLSEPTYKDDEHTFSEFYDNQMIILAQHRHSVTPLQDHHYQSSTEIAAKALTFVQMGELSLTGLLTNHRQYSADFVELFNANLLQQQQQPMVFSAERRRAVS
jgi:hypothetical protein